MTIRITIKKIRKEKHISLRKLEEETGIERKRLADIEDEKVEADKILFAEMIIIAEVLDCSILELYETGYLEIKGIGEI